MPGHFTFFTEQIEDGIAYFAESEYRHAIVSLRYQLHDKIQFSDGKGRHYFGEITALNKNTFSAKIEHANAVERTSNYSLAVGIMKSSDRMEWMVEKCTELGAANIYFVKTTNSERSRLNTEKLKKTAIAALKQSHGSWLPLVAEVTWAQVLSNQSQGKYIAAIDAALALELKNVSLKPESIFLIGPEGDFTGKELQEAIHSGYQPIGLGSHILRTETAAIIAIAHAYLNG